VELSVSKGSATPRRGSLVLGLIPAVVALVVGGLMLPRAVVPGDVPLPLVDARALGAIEAADDARAAAVLAAPLSPEVRAAGQAIRVFNGYEAADSADAPWPEARAAIDAAVELAVRRETLSAMVALRSVQLARFMSEVRAFSASGTGSAELEALAGHFLKSMAGVGWLDGRRIAMDEHALRAAFKLKWNATAHLDGAPALALALDEQRALFSFFLSHPHATDASRYALAAARRTARSRADCEALDEGERLSAEVWRNERIEKLARIDPEYPAAYARGIGEFRAARYEASALAFQSWIEAHPNGAYALRSKNYLRAALSMSTADR
jgi:hypothetical protein